MDYDPTEYDECDEHVPYEMLDGLDLIIADMELTESFRDETLALDDLDDIPY